MKSSILRFSVLLFSTLLVHAERPEVEFGRSPDYDYDPPEPGTYELPPLGMAADGTVLDTQGNKHRLSDILEGKITILSFIYTRCADPQGCPIATGSLYIVHEFSEESPKVARNLQLVTFSFDPEHDTPQVMRRYGSGLRKEGEGAPWHFLTTPGREEIREILAGYGQAMASKRDPSDPYGPFYHQLRVYLIDAKGRIRNIYSFGLLDPRMLMTDVRTLLMETD